MSQSERRRGWIIAIDGPSGAGKSTVAKEIARRLGYLYIDTGAMYRAIGLKALQENPRLDDPQRIITIARQSKLELKSSEGHPQVWLDGADVTEDIRVEAVSQAASIVSSISEVRKVLVQAQQELGAAGSVVMEGRDIGTKVFPNADLKIFLDATERTRAQRRFEENRRRGANLTLDQTIAEIHERDQRDSLRSASPLTQAKNAVYIDTSEKSIEQVIQEILALVQKLRASEENL
ncbi:MAG: (d)CMP kinase [Acidobacteria bacterium]|nr:MAG: (d)CMP kinase [Acidobacteriota bacterium]